MFASPSQFAPTTRPSSPLAGLASLAGRVALYVPTTYGTEGPAAPSLIASVRAEVSRCFAMWFGGFTEVRGEGGWVSGETGRTVREPVWIVYAACSASTLAEHLPELVQLARDVGIMLSQESVAVDVNGTLYFVPPPAHIAEGRAALASAVS